METCNRTGITKITKITLLQMLHDDVTLLDRIAWSDEATFNLPGTVNRRQHVFWSGTNPGWRIQKKMKSPSLSVMAIMTSHGVLGPFFFPGSVTGDSFMQIMSDEAHPALLQLRMQHLIFQLDGAPGHWKKEVRQWLNSKFNRNWIGRDGPIAWPARSPDLTPLDFFFWGFIKNKTFSQFPSTMNDFKTSIIKVFSEVTVEMAKHVLHSVEQRLRDCIKCGGGHIE